MQCIRRFQGESLGYFWKTDGVSGPPVGYLHEQSKFLGNVSYERGKSQGHRYGPKLVSTSQGEVFLSVASTVMLISLCNSAHPPPASSSGLTPRGRGRKQRPRRNESCFLDLLGIWGHSSTLVYK